MNSTPLLVFPDTNVLIQGKALRELPWRELGHDPIEVVICGPVIRELDRLKNKGGRAGRVARAMSTTVRDLIAAPDKSDVLRDTEPRVIRRLLLGASVREAVRVGLDLGHDDQAIINQALAVADAGGDVLLLTDDNFAAMTAEEHGLRTFMLPSHWLKEPEADDSAKEIARRDAEIARLKSAEPSPRLWFTDEHGTSIERLDATIKRYLPVEASEVEQLVERVARAAPMSEVQLGPKPNQPDKPGAITRLPLSTADMMKSGMLGAFKPVTKADVETYASEYASWLGSVRSKIAGFHAEWNRRRDWPRAQLLAVNEGSRPAEVVLVEVEASGSFLLSGFEDEKASLGDRDKDGLGWLSLPLPPEPPRPRHPMESMLRDIDRSFVSPAALAGLAAFKRPNLRRDADAFYWREGKRDPVDVISLECGSWRHGRDEEGFRWRVWADDDEDVRGLVIGRISASNLTRPIEARLPLRITFEDKDTLHMAKQLVDDFERRVAKPSPRR